MPEGPARALVEDIHHDEVKWCVLLMRAIRALDSKPGTRTGAFHEKAMAIADLRERMAFLNRGQGWVAKKLRELLPMVDDAQMHAGLTEMLRAHEGNLERVNQWLEAKPQS
jgi:nitronate monooxygenase